MKVVELLLGGDERESDKVSRGNERSNILLTTRMVLRAFLDEAVHQVVIEGEVRSLSDLFVMLEKVLWHGFRSSVQRTMIALRSPDTELWGCIGRVACGNAEMKESYRCIDRLDNITSSLIRIRAFLRLAVMQKKLADYFDNLIHSSCIRDFYEPWALIRHEECIGLSGALIALSVLDCNLEMDQVYLENQPLTVELSTYVRVRSLPTDASIDKKPPEIVNKKTLERILDQKNYLEERNHYLEYKMAELKKKMEFYSSAGNNINVRYLSISQANAETENASAMAVDESSGILKAMQKEKEELAQIVSEKEDSIRILRQQLTDTKKVNVDLYEKIRIIEGKCRQFENEIASINKWYDQEKEQQLQIIESLKKSNHLRELALKHEAGTTEMLKKELAEKTEEYMQTLDVLEKKQKELVAANDRLGKLQVQTAEQNEKLKQLPVIKQELEELTTSYKYKSEKLEDCEKALEELGGHLSESKLKVVELKEELLPLSEAEWEKDGNVPNCKGCNLQFSMSKRKHHCRNCGSIFCNSCTDARVKLPSNAKPVRVCLHCYNLLRSRHNSTLEDNSSLNSFNL